MWEDIYIQKYIHVYSYVHVYVYIDTRARIYSHTWIDTQL